MSESPAPRNAVTGERAPGESAPGKSASGESAPDEGGVGDGIAVRRRPTRVSATVAALAAAGGVLLVGGPGRPAVGVLLVGLAVMAVGDELRTRGRRAPSLVALAAGGAVGLAGLAAGVAMAGDLPDVLRVLPGLLGLLALGAGVVPVRGRGSRRLVKIGAGLVLVSVLVAGVFRAAPPGTLVAGAVAAVVAWDLGEHAINVGEQLGRAASTWRTEGTHAAGAGVVGVAALVAANVVDDVGSYDLSLPALALLVVAVVLLSVALHE
ncbi:DUF7519 family protein [Halorussus salinus]|uniref:DUF7519 family protein n=1 Tax=Halorussus salinus TaxID=1364935 RepID=UPI001092160A|nr:hypothetical protein [Halorussus salinus]